MLSRSPIATATLRLRRRRRRETAAWSSEPSAMLASGARSPAAVLRVTPGLRKLTSRPKQIELAALERLDHLRLEGGRRQSQRLGHRSKSDVVIDAGENAAGPLLVGVRNNVKIVAHDGYFTPPLLAGAGARYARPSDDVE